VASQVDVLPTIADLTQTSHINSSMGRSLLDEAYDDERYAFTIEHGGGRVIGLLTDEYYFMMRYDGSDAKLHRLDSETPRDDISAAHPQLTQELAEYTAAFRDTIEYMRENNKPGDIAAKAAKRQ
jgi:hypothetical protein